MLHPQAWLHKIDWIKPKQFPNFTPLGCLWDIAALNICRQLNSTSLLILSGREYSGPHIPCLYWGIVKGSYVSKADVVVWGKVGGLLVKLRFKVPDLGLGVVVHTFHPSNREAETGGFLWVKSPTWSIEWAPGHPGLHSEKNQTKKMSDLISLELQMDPFTSGYIYWDCTEPIQDYFYQSSELSSS